MAAEAYPGDSLPMAGSALPQAPRAEASAAQACPQKTRIISLMNLNEGVTGVAVAGDTMCDPGCSGPLKRNIKILGVATPFVAYDCPSEKRQ